MRGIPRLFALFPVLVLASCSGPDCNWLCGHRTPNETVSPAPASGVRSIPITPDNTKIEFVGSNPKHSQPGSFQRFTGQLELNEAQALAKLAVEVQMDSTATNIFLLTRHLKGADFFDVEHYPTASLVSTAVEPGPGGESVVTGNLTFHGVTRQVRFPATIARDNGVLTLKAGFTLRQTEFGMEKGAKLANDEVPVSVFIRSAG